MFYIGFYIGSDVENKSYSFYCLVRVVLDWNCPSIQHSEIEKYTYTSSGYCTIGVYSIMKLKRYTYTYRHYCTIVFLHSEMSNVIEAISMLYMYPHNIVLSEKSGYSGYSGYRLLTVGKV